MSDSGVSRWCSMKNDFLRVVFSWNKGRQKKPLTSPRVIARRCPGIFVWPAFPSGLPRLPSDDPRPIYVE
ncbi:hypothetical protein V1477_004665 [Vespula maculifrons]|uniref:Uncharacterized protein n=1 Tax=Vespula maculifrons TaxID=7453 RepID=A0ABD2CMH9_VESMC